MNSLKVLFGMTPFAVVLSVASLHAGEKKFYRSGTLAEDWTKANQARPEATLIREKIVPVPQFIWLTSGPIEPLAYDAEKARANKEILPVLLYNIPGRDNGNYSAGGLSGPSAYRTWVGEVAKSIGNADAICVIEPDAIGLAKGLSSEVKRVERYQMLSNAVDVLKSLKHTKVYIDVSHWLSPEEGAQGLKKAGIAKADGFCLNSSNFERTEKMVALGEKISSLVGGKHFIIDTSRNGNGPWQTSEKDAWCNPPGRALGARPTFETGHPLVDAFVWIKRPGESDGSCRGGPNAGVFWPEYAAGLAKNAK